MSTAMTLNDLEPPKQGVLVNFSQFRAATRTSRVDCVKWLEIDQDNLRMKFSALNVDFSNSSPDPLGSRRSAHAGVKEGYPSKKWLFIRCCLV